MSVSDIIIKKLLCVLVLLSILICTAPPACAETEDVPVGFGFVNAKDVALRREACGKIIARLPKDACVWVKDAKTDAKGVPVAQSERRAESSQQNSPPVNAEPWAQIGYKKVRKVVEYV